MHHKSDDLIRVMRKKGFLTSHAVENAIRETPRHFFVPENHLDEAYEDRPIETKKLQTISQPSVVARMTEWLDVKPGLKILEIGAGSGWQSAILARLVSLETVYSIERHSELVEFAKSNHRKAQIKNVKIIHGDGTLGLAEMAPFDRIIITAACEKVPEPLFDQLTNGGLLIAPVGKNLQTVVLYRKKDNKISEEKIEYGYAFIPLIGKFGYAE